MPFTLRDFEGLLRALEKRAEWRAQLRRLLLTDELLSLPEIVRQLAVRVEQLAAAQQRTETRLEQLAAAQQRTETRLEQLAAAQQRTETRLEQLAAAQQRTETHLEQLADAQRRTEGQVTRLVEEMHRLAEAQRETARQLGTLAETLGFTLEDLAREVAPAYLEKHCGIRVGALERRFLTVDGEEVEVDLYGEGRATANAS
ncbi:MAG: hypothetical protein QN157_08130 [Armatimonadota bacterium]|nr:hypothetical protein [Armatimonadota bacterium]